MVNKDYSYCTDLNCPMKEQCKRYNKEALNCNEPLYWIDCCYNNKEKTCEFIDEKN